MLFAAGVPMSPKAFQLGLRIEQPQAQIDRNKYGKPEYRALLGAADYTIQVRGQRDVFTFCMCAGGVIIPSISEPGRFCTNGMSNSRHDSGFANSGVMVTLEPTEFGSDHPLAGMELQRQYEAMAFELGGRDYLCPIQSARDFLAGRSRAWAPGSESGATQTVSLGRRKASDTSHPPPQCSYQRGAVPAQLDPVLPPGVMAAIRHALPIMDKKLHGNFLRHAVLVGPEMRGSSPIRIARDSVSRECPNIRGLYPVGEGAGYAGGIVSAAVDGLRSARVLVERCAPCR
jgi:uncharacterized FAD-dependent dehydrogenase